MALKIYKISTLVHIFSFLLLPWISTHSLAKLPDGFFIDQGYTYFYVESVSEPIDGKAVDMGFKLSGAIRIFGDAPERSSIKLVLKKDGDIVAQRRTSTEVLKRGHPKLDRAVGGTSAKGIEPHLLSGIKHQGALDAVTTGVGEYEVDVVLIDGNTEKEYLAHTYTLNIGKVDHLDAIGNELVIRPPEYFVSRHQEALSTILTSWRYYGADKAGGKMVLLWNHSPDDTRSKISNDEFFKCTVNGEEIKLLNPNDPQAENISKLDGTMTREGYNTGHGVSERNTVVTHKDRNALEYRSGSDYREELIFYQNLTILPFVDSTDGYPPKDYVGTEPHISMTNHHGRWECQWMDNGKLLRTFSWEVDDKGQLIPHPEQEEGLTLNPNAILVETVIPEKGAPFDARLVPDAIEDGGFYGWEWESSEMEDLAEDVPKIGNPFPVPSAPEFIPEPDKGPSSLEILREKQKQEAEQRAMKREAELTAQKAESEAMQKQYAEEEQARLAKIEEAQKAAYAEAEKKAQATVEEVSKIMEDAQQQMNDAQSQSLGTGTLYVLMRVLLAVALVISGLVLAGGALKAKLPQVAGLVDTLTQQAGMIGIITIGLALFDFLLDIIALRPIVGDGLPQILALATGLLAASETLSKQPALQKVYGVLDELKGNSSMIGIAALAVGVLHLLIGGVILL